MTAPHVSMSDPNQRNELWSTLTRARGSKAREGLSSDALREGAEPLRVLVSRHAKKSAAPQPVAPQAPSTPVESSQLAAPDLEALTVEGLQAVWGQADPRYDLDGDGAVGFNDLTLLLRQLSQESEKPETAPAAADEVDPALAALSSDAEPEAIGPLTVDGLFAAYGTADKRYDLDGDGTVGFNDLTLLLQQQSQPAQPARQAEVVEDAAALGSEAPAESEALTVDGLQAAWGTDDERYDLDGDHVVGFNDLTILLRRLDSARALAAEDESVAPRSGAAGAPQIEPTRASDARLKAFARSLVDRLDRAGFAERPPLNLHHLVDGLQLRADHQKTLLERLSKHYPDGLGLNVKG